MKRLVLIGLLLTGGCGIFEPASDDEERLENAIAGWKRLGITEYTYVYSRTCECPPSWQQPTRVKVRNGEVVEATEVASGAVKAIDRMPTIDDLFEMIRNAFEESADVIRIDYDSKQYYPVDMLIDDDVQVVDNELIMRASALVPVR